MAAIGNSSVGIKILAQNKVIVKEETENRLKYLD